MNSPSCGESISNHEYHHGRDWEHLVSSTQFKRFYDSPAAFKWPLPFSEGAATDLGTSTHSAVLEPAKLSDLIVLPDLPCRSNADKEDWRRWLDNFGANQAAIDAARLKDDFVNLARTTANLGGKSIVSSDQFDAARAMAISVQENEDAQLLLTGEMVERSFRAYGLRARPDSIKGSLLCDLKTCAQLDRFKWIARDLKYPSSLAFYQLVLDYCKVTIETWSWVVVESTPYRLDRDGTPRHRVKVFVASEDMRLEAMASLRDALDAYRECKKADFWPDNTLPIEELFL